MMQLDSIKSPNGDKNSVHIDLLLENTEELKNNLSANENTIGDIDYLLNDFPINSPDKVNNEDDTMTISPNK